MNHNTYTTLGDGKIDYTTATDTTITNVAALTTRSTITASNTVHESVINAINQLNASQAALVQQMAAMLLTNHNHTLPPAQITVPVLPMQQLTIPMQVPYAGAAAQNTFNVGRGGQDGQGGQLGQGNGASRGGGRNLCTPFANHVRKQTQIGGGRGGRGNDGSIPIAPEGAGTVGPPATQARAYWSNITKLFANWNVCYLCGFDIKDGHTSVTCPHAWRRTNHQEGFTRGNAQAYLNAG